MIRKRLTAVFFVIVFALCGVNLWRMAHAQNVNRNDRHKRENYVRPKPTKPLKPTIPASNRYQSDKVFLEQADSLYKRGNDTIERQIVSGTVKFRHGAMWMFCDSAFYYPERNSMDAFGHVKMQQGDTLFVYADKLFYDGDAKYARLENGPTQSNVMLKDSQGTLVTDTLHYYLDQNRGLYDCWGTLEDGDNTLRSREGIYDTDTKDAQFFFDVSLENKKDGYQLLTDTLYYNTATHIARIETPTDIYGPTDTIHATHGWYNTANDSLELTGRSMIAHTDSVGRTTTLEGDSIIYDKKTRISQAFRFRDARRRGAPVVLTDTANKTTLVADFASYNDMTREAIATDYPLLMEYSRPDTLFLRADTILTYIRMTEPPKADSPLPLPTSPDIFSVGADSVEPVDSVMREVDGVPEDSVMREVADVLKDSAMQKVQELPQTGLIADTVSAGGFVPREYRVAEAIGRARFFGQDIQGVADTIIVSQADSILRMLRKPVAWSGERQVSGREIIVHFNDSTADWALIPAEAKVMEHVEEEFFNQIAGKEMKAKLADGTLKHLDVDGNVQLMFLPVENDSTISRLVYAESGWMTVDMEDGKLENLKMWPEVSGTVTPIFRIKKSEQRNLHGFVWLDAIRPRRTWYGDRLHWDDDLGELPEALEQYFEE